MNEWKKLTSEQVAWLEEQPKMINGSVMLVGAEFSTEGLGAHREWLAYMPISQKYHTPYWRPQSYRALEVLKMAGFPMGEAEQAEATAVAENPWVYAGFDLKSSQIKSMYDIQNEQAKTQADAEWQRERRAAWVEFACASMAGSVHLDAVEWADIMLEEFDKRFGEQK